MASKGYLARKERENELEKARIARDSAHRVARERHLDTGVKAVSDLTSSIIKAANDVSWYNKWGADDPRFINLPTFENNVQDREFKQATTFDIGSYDKVVSTTSGFPSVVAINYLPRLGYDQLHQIGGTFGQFPINPALSMTLSQIGKVNSRQVASDPDVMGLYVVGVTEIACFLMWLKTNLEAFGYYSKCNPLVKEAILSARGISPAFVSANVAELRKLYNLYAARFNVEFALPASLSYVARRIYIDSVLFKDQNLEKAQIITFSRYLGLFGSVSEDMDAVDYDQTNFTSLAQVYAFMERAFARLTLDGDVQTLTANIRAALPADKLVKLPEAVGDFVTEIPVSDEMLTQLHNMETLPQFDTIPVNNVKGFVKVQTTGDGLQQSLDLSVNSSPGAMDPFQIIWMGAHQLHGVSSDSRNHFMDLYTDDINPDMFLTGTRLHPIRQYGVNFSSGGNMVWLTSYTARTVSEGTEYPVSISLWGSNPANSNTTEILATFYSFTRCGDMNAPTDMSSVINVCYSQYVDWIPVCYLVYSSVASYVMTEDAPAYMVPMNQFGNYFPITAQDLSRIHQLCTRSLYYTDPSEFKFVK